MTLKIAEIFGPTIQGEGALIGVPTVFVRAGGCDYRCRWCDSLHAVESRFRHDWTALSTGAVWDRVTALSGGQPLTVTLSGGNPAIQDFGPLIARGQAAGYRFAMETQGSVAQDWFAALDMLVLSPKPPSSGETPDWAAFDACLAAAGHGAGHCCSRSSSSTRPTTFGHVTRRRATRTCRSASSPATTPRRPPTHADAPIDMAGVTDRMTWLVERTLADGWFAPRILPQLHVMLWGNKRGV